MYSQPAFRGAIDDTDDTGTTAPTAVDTPSRDEASSEGIEWIEDPSFVRDTAALKAQLASLQAQGGGDEPESLLDAVYQVATMETTPKGSSRKIPTNVRASRQSFARAHAT